MADQASGLLSPWLRRRRLEAAAPWLAGRVLDVGCGSGALAARVGADRYRGVDIDADSVALARAGYPSHRFESLEPGEHWNEGDASAGFDTVAMLAVIEHTAEPGELLRRAAAALAPGGRIVLTTPAPALEWAHALGARVGLFSAAASEEHQSPIGRRRLNELARQAGLRVVHARRFLGGANQLFVLEPAPA